MCEIAVTATSQNLSVLRDRVQLWLTELGWPAEAAADIVLAVNEAATNAVEHAYPGGGGAGQLVEIEGRVESDVRADWPGTDWRGGTRRVRVSVRDYGRWRPDVHNRSDLTRTRGPAWP